MTATNSPTDSVDVAVLGGGPSGAAAAYQLAAAGIETALIHRPRARRPCGEVMKASTRLRLGELWHSVTHAIRPIHEIASSWGGDEYSSYSVHHIHGPGWLIDRQPFEDALIASCTRSGVQVDQTTATVLDRHAEHWLVGLENGHTIRARFLVDATGRAAVAVRQHGSRRRVDGLVARTCVRAGGDTAPRLVVRAEPDGWRYTVPTFDGSALIETRITDGMPDPLAGYRPAGMAIAHWSDDRLVPIGDALVSLDPLSGDGFGFGIVSAQEATVVICDALRGDETAIARYRTGANTLFGRERERRRQAYLGEQRWSSQQFWRRRHQPCR